MENLLKEFAPLFKKHIRSLLQSDNLSASELIELYELLSSENLNDACKEEATTVTPVEVTAFEAVPAVEPAKEDDFIYTREAVREILTEASRKGIKIKDIMVKYIPEGMPNKLSSVPASSYSALVAELEV